MHFLLMYVMWIFQIIEPAVWDVNVVFTEKNPAGSLDIREITIFLKIWGPSV